MGKLTRPRRPSAPMIVSVVALVFAVTGAAVALPGKNKVDSGDIKNGQVKKNDISKQAKPRWVFVNGDTGAIFNQSGGIKVEREQEGVYDVEFSSSVRNYGLQMLNNAAGGGNQNVIVSAQRCGNGSGDQPFCPNPNPRFIDVHTVKPDGSHSDANFTLMAVPK